MTWNPAPLMLWLSFIAAAVFLSPWFFIGVFALVALVIWAERS